MTEERKWILAAISTPKVILEVPGFADGRCEAALRSSRHPAGALEVKVEMSKDERDYEKCRRVDI